VEWTDKSAVFALEIIKNLCLSDGIVKADFCEAIRLEKPISGIVTCLSSARTLSWATQALGEVSYTSEVYVLVETYFWM
jgi:hypothetical protein